MDPMQQVIKVLITDDNEDIRRVIAQRLRRDGYHILEAEDGMDAVRVFQEDSPDIVLLDAAMPRMNGFDACEFIRGLPEGAYTPIMMITAFDDDDSVRRAFEAGATDYVTKPIRWVIFENRVRYLARNARVEQARRHYAAQLELHNQELDAYAYSIAHDLKNPLSVITTCISYINHGMEEEVSADMRRFLEKIEATSFKMVTMIDQLLHLARLRDEDTVREEVNVGSLVGEILLHHEKELQEKKISIEVQSPLPNVLGYSAWVEEAFSNLIANAIKYMGEGDERLIRVRGQQMGDFVRYEVHDSGIGIAPDDHKLLFRMLTRLKPRMAEGSGMGLAIVKRIVENLGGEVGVESAEGQGSTFWFTLPSTNNSPALKQGLSA